MTFIFMLKCVEVLESISNDNAREIIKNVVIILKIVFLNKRFHLPSGLLM